MATARILEVAQNVQDNMTTVVKTNQDVRDNMSKLEAETRITNRTTQAISASVYRSLDPFINVLTDFLALCQNRSGQYQRFVKSQFYVVNCRR